MEKQLELSWQSGIFLLTCLALMLAARGIFKLFNYRINIGHELTERDNLAFFLGYVSYFVSVTLVIGGVMNSEGSGKFWTDIVLTLVYGLSGILLLNIAFMVLDKLIHRSVVILDEITERGNLALGVLKGSNYLGTGIIISGVLLTEVNRPMEAIVFLINALFLGLIGFFYFQLITRYSLRDEIYKGNVAVACSTAGAQIGFSILIYAGFQITHTTWIESLSVIGIDMLAGFIILPLVRLIVDKIFITGRNITDELIHQEVPNLGVGIFEGSAYVAGALLFVWCWNL